MYLRCAYEYLDFMHHLDFCTGTSDYLEPVAATSR